MTSMKEIQQLADDIVCQFDPEKVILFGSYALGNATVDSDVDLLVILPFEGRNLDKSVEMLVKTNPPFPIDLLARKPDDTERRYRLGDPLIRAALDHGKVLHDRSGHRMAP